MEYLPHGMGSPYWRNDLRILILCAAVILMGGGFERAYACQTVD